MVADTSPTRRRAIHLGGAALTAGLAGCSGLVGGAGDGGAGVTDVRLVLNWKPNPTQAGYFVAKDRGFYEEEGLAVELVPGQGGSFATKQVGLGNYEFGLGSGVAVLQARANDLAIRSYAAAQQSSNAALYTVAKALDRELTAPKKLAGTRIAVVSGSAKTRAYLRSMLSQAGIRDGVEFVSVGVEQQTANLLSGNVDVAIGIFSDALALDRQGYDASMLLIGDHVPTVGRCVFARPAYVEKHPETVRALLRGTARGWAWASNNPKAAEQVMIDARPSLSKSSALGIDKIRFSARKLIETAAVEKRGWGWQSPSVWSSVHETLSASGVLPADLDVKRAWTNGYRDADATAIANYAERVTFETGE